MEQYTLTNRVLLYTNFNILLKSQVELATNKSYKY